MNDLARRLPYDLPRNKSRAIAQLAAVLGITKPDISGNQTAILQAMSGTILFRHLPQKPRDEVWRIIQQQKRPLRGRLSRMALHSKYINPDWGVWSLSTEEVNEEIARNKAFLELVGAAPVASNNLGVAKGVWDIATKRTVSAAGPILVAAGVLVFFASELSKDHLERLREERLDRLKPANANTRF